MAGIDTDVEEAPAPAVKGPSVMKWVVPGGLAIFLAVLGAQVSAPLLTGLIAAEPKAAAGGDAIEDEAEPVVDEVDYRKLDPAIYTPLDPALLASFESENGTTRYLQLSLQAMARSQQDIDAIKTHSPAIRNAILFLLSRHGYAELVTLEGKEKLRSEMLGEAQQILRRNTGRPGVEEIYFTSFVVQ
jgi:flagellar protein FliL